MNKSHALALVSGVLFTATIVTEAAVTMPSISREYPIPLYNQHVTLHFTTEQAAQQAKLSIAPVYNGHSVAITCRWDDANDQNTTAHRLMAQRGLKGSYYLNSNWQCDLHRDDDYAPQAMLLLKDGQSIGGHAMSHPYITYLSRNRMFEEMLGVRIEWEARCNTAINSYTFSYVDIRNVLEGDTVHADVMRCLMRSGYQGIAEFAGHADLLDSGLAFSTILAPENSPYDEWKRFLDWSLQDGNRISKRRALSNSMHAWYGTPLLPYGWDELEKRLDAMQAVPDAWNCNQNEFAAYWQQSEHSKLSVHREGATLKLAITRPSLTWLNDPIPLTVLLNGVAPEALLSTDGADVQRHGAVLNLPHSAEQRMPMLVGAIDNEANDTDIRFHVDDADFPGLHALLYRKSGQLRLQIDNQSGQPISHAVIQYRLPLIHPEGVVQRPIPDISVITQFQDTLRLQLDKLRDTSDAYGQAYYAAQIDFLWGETPSRLYVTCRTEPLGDASLPSGRFQVMGPIAPDSFSYSAFDECVKTPRPITELTGKPWQNSSPDIRVNPSWVHPEVVTTSGSWRNLSSSLYILRSRVYSPVAQSVRLIGVPGMFKRILLNGLLVTDLQGDLNAGANELILVYHFDQTAGSPAHLGSFIRLCDVKTGKRLKNIRYEKE